MDPRIDIRPLHFSESDLIRKIAGWYRDEWQTPLEDTLERLGNPDPEDIHLVLSKDDDVLATGAVTYKVNLPKVYPEMARLGPWIGWLYTADGARGQGLGALLLQALESRARDAGHAKLYLYTSTAESLYRRNDWQVIRTLEYKGLPNVVMEKSLLNPN